MKTALPILLCCALMVPRALPGQTVSELTAAREQARASVDAYRAQDWSTTDARLTEALKVQPHHPIWLYNLACTAALRGEQARALMLLDTIAALGFSFDAEGDEDFASLRASAEFQARVAALEANRARVGNSKPLVAIESAAFLAEGIAFDPASRAVFVSSVHERKIVRVMGGTVTTLADSSAGLWAVLGIAYSKRTKSVWAVTSVFREMAGYTKDAKGTALVEVDAATGAVRRRLIPPGEHRSFNDLTVDDETGVVYVSDAGASAILEWSEKRGWRELAPPGLIFNPSGLAVMPRSDWLYVADYVIGLVRVSRTTGKVERVTEAKGISTYGTDGLAHYNGDLIVIQNAVQPHRVARVKLDATGSRIVGLAVLERGSPYFDEPTLGVVAGDVLLYVANSGWGKFRDGRYVGSEGGGPVVLGLGLGPRSGF